MEKYEKIQNFDSENLFIFYEKVDGSNVSFKKTKDGKLSFFSRKRELLDIENEDIFKKLLKIYDTEFYKNMPIDILFFGELLGMAKIPYNKNLVNKKIEEELFIFDAYEDNKYWEPSKLTKTNLYEFRVPEFKVVKCKVSEIKDFIDNDKISFIDNKSKIEGYIIRSFNDNSFKFKYVTTEFQETKGIKNTKVDPNIRSLEKWIQKFTLEEPVKNIKEFLQKCKEDFESENQNCNLNIKNILPLIEENNLAEFEYFEREIYNKQGEYIKTLKQPINFKALIK